MSRKPKQQDRYNWRKKLAALIGIYARNTLTGYASDFAVFEHWCRSQNRTMLPASPQTVAAFLMAQSATTKIATVRRRSFAIGRIHRLFRLENPLGAQDVIYATRTIQRRLGTRQHHALGLTSHLKEKLLGACDGGLAGMRDRALITVGYESLSRRDELARLRIEDLTIKANGSASILIRTANPSIESAGRRAFLSAETVGYLLAWLNAANIEEGAIFRGMRNGKVFDAKLNPLSITFIIKRRARKAGLDEAIVHKLSGHSLRVGAAQDMARAGIDIGAIMVAGGWKSPITVRRYIEKITLERSGTKRFSGVTEHNGCERA